jgi:hypothetical protein
VAKILLLTPDVLMMDGLSMGLQRRDENQALHPIHREKYAL